MMARGKNPEYMEELHDKYRLEGMQKYEKFINEKTRFNSKEMIIEAYEEVLQEKRQLEKNILNGCRFKEYEKNRPPQNNWYELKSGEFSKELYRNRMALKPEGENNQYL
jgi:hypothetical protein